MRKKIPHYYKKRPHLTNSFPLFQNYFFQKWNNILGILMVKIGYFMLVKKSSHRYNNRIGNKICLGVEPMLPTNDVDV